MLSILIVLIDYDSARGIFSENDCLLVTFSNGRTKRL